MKFFILFLFLSLYYNAWSIPEKPRGCRTYYCSDEDWKKGLKRFDPLSIRWPLHYDGSTYRDRSNGGYDNIDVIYKDHKGNAVRSSLSSFRNRPECPDPQYLSEGIKMPDGFVCRGDSGDRPSWESTACSMVESSMEELTLSTEGGGCGKKLKFWVVIDWCTFVPNGNVGAESNKDQYTLVKDYDSDAAFFAFADEPGLLQEDGYYTFTQVVKIVDNESPEILICDDIDIDVKSGCSAEVVLHNTVKDTGACPGNILDVTLEVYDDQGLLIYKKHLKAANGGSVSQNIGRLGLGEYQVFWKLKDACGNYDHCSHKLTLLDKSEPYLLCIKTLSTSLSHEEGLSIWAKDFVLKMDDSCDEEVIVSFDQEGRETQMSFDCGGGPGFHDLLIYATDTHGNQSSCAVELFIADREICADSMISIGGLITDRYGRALTKASVRIDGLQKDRGAVAVNQNGQYFIPDVPSGAKNLSLAVEINDGMGDGIDAYDLLRLASHMDDIERFTDVLEYAAADINNDAAIDIEDFWALAYLVYDIPYTIERFQPWKFVDQKLYLSGINRASKLTGPVKISASRSRYDLLGLKSGDVDFSWGEEKAEVRSAPLTWLLAEKEDHNELNFGSIALDGVTLWVEGESIETFKNNNPQWTEDRMHYLHLDNGALYVYFFDNNLLNAQNRVLLSQSAKVVNHLSLAWTNEEDVALYSISIQKQSGYLSEESIFPNPFENTFTIQLRNGERFTSDIQIYSTDGRLIKCVKPGSINNQNIDFSTDVYFGPLLIRYDVNDIPRYQKLIRH